MRVFLYLMLIFAEFLILDNEIFSLTCFRKRYWNNKIYDTKFFNYFRKMFTVISGEVDKDKIRIKTYKYLIFNCFTFLIVFLLVFVINYGNRNIFYTVNVSIMLAIACVLIPFIIIRFKLLVMQSKSSYEAMILVSEIINQYKIYNHNILEAIDYSIKYLPDDLISKKCLLRLGVNLKRYRSDEELKEILDEFSFAIGTNWAIMLSNSIYIAVSDHFDITSSLQGILKQISIIDSNLKYGKKLTNEGFVLAKYFAPILYVIMTFIMTRMLSINFADILKYQFSDEGLKFFSIIIVAFCICFVQEYLYKNKKFDL